MKSYQLRRFSLVVKRQFRKLKIGGSIPPCGFFYHTFSAICYVRSDVPHIHGGRDREATPPPTHRNAYSCVESAEAVHLR